MQLLQDVAVACRMLNADLRRAAGADDRRRAAASPSAAPRAIDRAPPGDDRARARRSPRRSSATRRRRRRPARPRRWSARDVEIVMPLGGLIDVAGREGADREGHRQGRQGDRGAREEARQRRLPRARARGRGRRAARAARRRAGAAPARWSTRSRRSGGARVIARCRATRAALLVVDIQERLMPAMPADVARRSVDRATRAILIAGGARSSACRSWSASSTPRASARRCRPIEDALAGARAASTASTSSSSRRPRRPAFAALAPRLGRDQWIVCGMETHVCVYQTARDLVGARLRRRTSSPTRCAAAPTANWQHRPRPRSSAPARSSRRPRSACSICSAAPAPTSSARCRR